MLRRLLAEADAARPPSLPVDEHLLDPSKVRPLLAAPKEGVTEVEPLLHMLRAFGRMQAPQKP